MPKNCRHVETKIIQLLLEKIALAQFDSNFVLETRFEENFKNLDVLIGVVCANADVVEKCPWENLSNFLENVLQ